MFNRRFRLLLTCLLVVFMLPAWGANKKSSLRSEPPSENFDSKSALVLFDGADRDDNPGCIDARYLANLLGHFTARRRISPLEDYKPGDWKSYDAVFVIIYRKTYQVPEAFLRDAPQIDHTFCWLGTQAGQLDKFQVLRKHGIQFKKFFVDSPFDRVLYKKKVLTKGDPDTAIFDVIEPSRAQVRAMALSKDSLRTPYILQSDNFWIVADSPFSYSSENDRYLAFADILHDILGIEHAETHKALVRVEDLNAMSDPAQLEDVRRVMENRRVPFSFGVVPYYVNPSERLFIHLVEKPAVVQSLQKLVSAGGVPVMHGYSHQHRGISTDDYEFWDDLGDRPVLGDSDSYAARRMEEGIRDLMNVDLFPVTWETPHYAGSRLDYKVFKRFFNTTYERRLVANRLGTDQYFPYPVIDIYGQYIIPESMAYISKEDPKIEPLLSNAEAELVVRDGYASFFIHPFLKPALLDGLLKGIKEMGFEFVDIRQFPNRVQSEGRLVSNAEGPVELTGHGAFVNEQILSASGEVRHQRILEVPPDGNVPLEIRLNKGETFVAQRQLTRPPNWFKRLVHVAKGDLSGLQDKFEAVFTGGPNPNPLKIAFLWDDQANGEKALDQASLFNTLSNMGYDIDRLSKNSLSGEEHGTFHLMIVPSATAATLTDEEARKIATEVSEGVSLVTDGESPLSKVLGIELSRDDTVSKLTNHLFPAQEIRWPDKPKVPTIVRPSQDEVDVFYSDQDKDTPLMIGGTYGEGRYIFMSCLFDPLTELGASRFPDLPYILYNQFRISPLVRRVGAEVYFDPGYRQSISIEKLARSWRLSGIRVVHAAAWHFYSKYSYDYARLIRVAHQNGILVYAWYELPHVSQRFWDQHPEWREKTGMLTDAHVDWRYMMNLQEPDCQKAVLTDMKSFLNSYAWDGVNLAEYNFESPAGPNRPELFTPFNAIVRKDFNAKKGFDPIELFAPASEHFWKTNPAGLQLFYEFRREVNSRLLESTVKVLKEVNEQKKGEFEIVLTVLDGLGHPELVDVLAIDMQKIIKLVNNYGLTLQAEDPASEWAKPPERYVALSQRYHALKLKKPFMIDINVLPIHPVTQLNYATPQATGPELFELWNTAAASTGRVCLYSESTVYQQDWELMPYVMAANTTINSQGDSWLVNAPNTVMVDVGKDVKRVLLDGRSWPGLYKGEVWVPPGEHTLNLLQSEHPLVDTTAIETRLIHISGELLGAQSVSRGIEVEYSSPHSCALVFNKEPIYTLLDGKWTILPGIRSDDGYVVYGPSGQHRLRAVTGTAFRHLLEYTSVVAASLIVLFGIASCSLLVVLFLLINLRRRTARIRHALVRLFWMKRKSKSKDR